MRNVSWRVAHIVIGIVTMYGFVLLFREWLDSAFQARYGYSLSGGMVLLIFILGFFCIGFLLRSFVPLWNLNSLILSWFLSAVIITIDPKGGISQITPQDIPVLFAIAGLMATAFAGHYLAQWFLQRIGLQ